jgi:hypothetical protein
MSKIDSEVLYLILTKVAAKESFYNYEPKLLPSTQAAGTVTHRQLGDVYERITGNRTGTRMNWNIPLGQLNALLALCKLPSLSPVILTSAEAGQPLTPSAQRALSDVHATKWPPFSALKSLYRRRPAQT